jgi:hypothetical protein
MANQIEAIPVRPKKDTFLIVSSALLLLFTGGFLWAAFSRYQNRIATISLSESRFVKTEWHLLQDLKAQTDQELLEKDQEIADLNRRYLSLVRQSATPAEIRQVQGLIEQAKAQRETILARRDLVSTESDPAPSESGAAQTGASSPNITGQDGWLTTVLPSAGSSVVTNLLRDRIAALESQLKESRGQSDELAKELSAEKARMTYLETTLKEGLASQERRAGEVKPPDIEELDTRALVRAIVASPEIRAKYPDLLNSLDAYFAEYGSQERVAGRREAYASAADLLKRVTAETQHQ